MTHPMTSLLTLSELERSKLRSLVFQSLISRKGAELGPMLPLTINKKSYMVSPMTTSLLTLSDIERSKSRLLGLQSLISHKGAELGPVLLLTINRKPWVALKGQSLDTFRVPSLIFRKAPKLGHMLLSTINRKPYMGRPMALSIWLWVIFRGQSQGHSDFKALYLVKEPS